MRTTLYEVALGLVIGAAGILFGIIRPYYRARARYHDRLGF